MSLARSFRHFAPVALLVVGIMEFAVVEGPGHIPGAGADQTSEW